MTLETPEASQPCSHVRYVSYSGLIGLQRGEMGYAIGGHHLHLACSWPHDINDGLPGPSLARRGRDCGDVGFCFLTLTIKDPDTALLLWRIS